LDYEALLSAGVSGLSLCHLILKGLTFYPYFKGLEFLQGHMVNKMKELGFKRSIPDLKFLLLNFKMFEINLTTQYLVSEH